MSPFIGLLRSDDGGNMRCGGETGSSDVVGNGIGESLRVVRCFSGLRLHARSRRACARALAERYRLLKDLERDDLRLRRDRLRCDGIYNTVVKNTQYTLELLPWSLFEQRREHVRFDSHALRLETLRVLARELRVVEGGNVLDHFFHRVADAVLPVPLVVEFESMLLGVRRVLGEVGRL